MTALKKLRHNGFDYLSESEVQTLLTAEGDLQQELFQLARDIRHECVGNSVMLRGVIEISNICAKTCDYCAMRSANNELNRYALSVDEIIRLAQVVKDSGIKTVFLQGGQFPINDTLLKQIIPVIKHDIGLQVLLCLGERPLAVFTEFFQLGAESYILKFETSSPKLYHELTRSDLDNRIQNIRWAREAGLKVGTGNIVGLPDQTLDTLIHDIRLGISINPDFISSSPFIPSAHTPLKQQPSGNFNITLNTIAIWRAALRTPAIPAVSALEILHSGGQKMGLDAGANVMTINFTPKETQSLYKIYSEKRFVVSLDHAMATIKTAGLSLQSVS